MSTPTTDVGDFTNREEFNNALSRLLETATANDVDVRGGHDVDAGGARYGIEIYRIAG